MIEYDLDTAHSILHVQPKSAIEQDDFVNDVVWGLLALSLVESTAKRRFRTWLSIDSNVTRWAKRPVQPWQSSREASAPSAVSQP